MRGVCQGCPLSKLLYIIAVEVRAIFVDADTRIKDTQTGEHEIKIVNFAHDTTISGMVWSGKVKNKRVLFTLAK